MFVLHCFSLSMVNYLHIYFYFTTESRPPQEDVLISIILQIYTSNVCNILRLIAICCHGKLTPFHIG